MAAFEDFGAQRDDCRPREHRLRVVAVQVLQAVGPASEHPIEGQEGRLPKHQADRPAGVHPEAVERCLGLAGQSLADP